MRPFPIGLIMIPAGLLIGCGTPTSSALPAPPHGGNMIALPDDKGFVEIMTDRGATSRGERRGQAIGNVRIIAYFYQPDGTTQMNPAPTEVKVKVGAAEGGSLVSLSQEPKEAGKYESAPGTYPDGFRGQIDFQSGGKPVHAPFIFR